MNSLFWSLVVINNDLSEQEEDHIVATQDRWLSVEEIAEHLGVSKESIYRWLERGKIPSHRVGKQWRFQTDEVNEWVRRGEASDDKHQGKYGSLSEGQHG